MRCQIVDMHLQKLARDHIETKFVKIDISGLPHLKSYLARVAARPGVQKALKAEGLA